MDDDFIPEGDRWHNTRWKLVVGRRGDEPWGIAVDVRHFPSYELRLETGAKPRLRSVGMQRGRTPEGVTPRRVPRSVRWALMKMLLELADLRPNPCP
jgi:hypothetical protein